MKKSTIYIDIDDDIAAIIEKLEAADQKIVAMVLPKRPSVLQGSVNLQLLKKAADDSEKNLVLITTDEQVLRLAGEIGAHVSGSLQSKPYVPLIESVQDTDELLEVMDDTPTPTGASTKSNPAQPDVYTDEGKVDLSTPIGQLAGDDSDEEIELDNAEPEVEGDATTEKQGKSSKKRIAVPNFGKFRSKLMLGGAGALALIGLLVWGLMFAPSATIVIRTEKSEVEGKITLTASSTTTAVDAEKGLVPAVRKEDKQKLTGTFAATGQKDVGEKATGTMTIRNCDYSDGFTLPAGTKFSNSGKVFVSTEAVSVPDFSGSASSCDLSGSESGKAQVSVVAEQSGDSYNLSARGYSIASISAAEEVDAVGSSMGGGTSKIVKIVTAEDIEAAKAKVLETGADNVKGKLAKLLSDEGLVAIEDTFVSADGVPSSSVPVGQEATADPTLTIEVTSSMLGMKKAEVEPLLTVELQKKIDTSKQKVYQSGVDAARISVLERPVADTVKLTLIANASVGPNLDQATVATEIAGKKAGEAKQLLEARPGVSGVDIDLSPFWVFSIPKKTDKIQVTINE
jgi:hypothetical protein